MQNADKDLLYLLRVLKAIGKILRYSEEYQTADEFLFSNNQKDYNASLLLLMQIGEQAAKVSTNTKANFPEIKCQTIKDFSNRIVHDYVNIDSLIVFSIIRHVLPPLVLQISNCIKEQISKNVFRINELEISKGSIFYQNINFSLLQ